MPLPNAISLLRQKSIPDGSIGRSADVAPLRHSQPTGVSVTSQSEAIDQTERGPFDFSFALGVSLLLWILIAMTAALIMNG
ncbi:MAG: hypothetical protein AAGB02_08800 [Pseudomonadota bacterium]